MKLTFKTSKINESAATKTNFLKTRNEIENWLIGNGASGFIINDDLTVDASKDIDLSGSGKATSAKLKEIPVKFRKTKSIDVSMNELTSLDWAPTEVHGDFDIWDNKLTSLEGSPSVVTGSFDCEENLLTSLDGAPSEVGGGFICSANMNLSTLHGIPRKVGTYLKIANCGLKRIDYFPEEIGSSVDVSRNNIMTFKGVEKMLKRFGFVDTRSTVGKFRFSFNPVKNGLSNLLVINGLKVLACDHSDDDKLYKAVELVNKMHQAGEDVFDIQEALAEAGLDIFA